jgi:GT2 family glycosyltransferase
MSGLNRPRFSVVIATYNRAAELRQTLRSLQSLRATGGWELIVADNNSTDDTAAVVRAFAATAPVSVRYVHETVQGRSAALNAAIRASSGAIVITTDDDVRVDPDWLETAGDALDRLRCGYIGGRVLPLWGGDRPSWLSDRGGPHWAVIALLDYGDAPLEFTRRMPLGVNMAFRREVFDTVGLWNVGIGRRAGTLLGQEVREWCIRARAQGIQGYYAPDLTLRHVIPPDRLSKRYFRRWFYWRGISRALLFQEQGLDMESPQDTRHDFSEVPLIAGVPRYLYRVALRHAASAASSWLRRRRVESFESELWLWMFVGIMRQRWRDRHTPFAWSPATSSAIVAAASEPTTPGPPDVGAARRTSRRAAPASPHEHVAM